MTILFVEDDQDLARAVEYRLKKEQMEVTVCPDGPSGFREMESRQFDLIILDRMLPGVDGIWLVQRLRAQANATPVLMLTAMDGVHDRVAGLDAGADDYLVKPFAMDELLARIRALSRRRAPWTPLNAVLAGDLSLDTEQLRLSCGERSVTLSRREANLMEFFMINCGQVLPRGMILDRVWSDTFVEEGSLEIYVHFLRKHLREIRSESVIETLRGIGYRLGG